MNRQWKATAASGETCHFGHEGTARAWAMDAGTVEKLVIRMPTEVPKGAVERELATARGLCSSVCDDDALNEADAELLKLRKIEESGTGLRHAVDGAGPPREGAGRLPRAARCPRRLREQRTRQGHQSGHRRRPRSRPPPGADWWSGKKETPNAI